MEIERGNKREGEGGGGKMERMFTLAILVLLYGTTVQTQHDKTWVVSA